jgi:hypothetical protein
MKAASEELTIGDFLKILQPYENRWDDMARDVFRNHQRTSTTSGILKSEAVYMVCRILQHLWRGDLRDFLARVGIRAARRSAAGDYGRPWAGHGPLV